uniref:Uncharacterized protein n=1 Tax=Anguilla anguilla TaxID=7936 RepID=A0A0E9WUW3_ANGAN
MNVAVNVGVSNGREEKKRTFPEARSKSHHHLILTQLWFLTFGISFPSHITLSQRSHKLRPYIQVNDCSKQEFHLPFLSGSFPYLRIVLDIKCQSKHAQTPKDNGKQNENTACFIN